MRFLLTTGHSERDVPVVARLRRRETPLLNKPWTVRELGPRAREVLGEPRRPCDVTHPRDRVGGVECFQMHAGSYSLARLAPRFLLAGGVLALLAVPAAASDGCGQCDFLITGRDGDSYTATIGNTVCVDESAIFTGTITLKGGAFEVCGAAIPSSVSFVSPAEGPGGEIVNHGTLRYFSLGLEGVTLDNHGVLMTYGDLLLGAGAELVNHEGAFVGIGAELRNHGSVSNDGIVDASASLRNLGRLANGGLINAHQQLVNDGELVNRGRINANELFWNGEDGTFESQGGTVAAMELFNEGLIFGDPSTGCNSLLVAGRWRQPGKGELVGSLDYCAPGKAESSPASVRSRTAKVTSCSCFNP